MRLVWHIVWKDCRRIAGPLVLWLILVLAHMALLFLWEGQAGTNPDAMTSKRYFINTCGSIVMAVGFLLAAWLVMEDSLVSTTAFWRTRPIHGLRLMAAKALGALLMLSVLPQLVLAPVWLGCGLSFSELWEVTFEQAMLQALCSIGAVAIGSVTLTSGQFLMRMLGAAIVLPLYLGFLFEIAGDKEGAGTRLLLTDILVPLILIAMVSHQFLTRRTGRTWAIFAAGVGLNFAIGGWWTWEFLPVSGRLSDEANPGRAFPRFTASRLTVEPVSALGSKRTQVKLEGRVVDIPADTMLRVDNVRGRWSGDAVGRTGPYLSGFSNNAAASEAVVRRLAGLRADPVIETTWTASGFDYGFTPGKTTRPRLTGVVSATVLGGVCLAQLPIKAGAEMVAGSSLTRIKSVRWEENRVEVLLEERDPWLMSTAGLFHPDRNPARQRIRPFEDAFIVLQRAHGFDQLPSIQEIGTVKANSMVVGRRSLIITPPDGAEADWLSGAVLLKVRFQPRDQIRLSLSGEPLEPSHP